MSDYSSGPLQFTILNCTRAPVSDETGELTPGVDYVPGENFWVKVGDEFYCCVDSNSVSALKFVKLGSLSSGQYAPRSPGAFATDYTPSLIKDTFVIFPFTQASVALGNATLNLLIDGVTIDTKTSSGLVSSHQDSFSFICPKGSTYRVNSSTTGIGSSNTAGDPQELPL